MIPAQIKTILFAPIISIFILLFGCKQKPRVIEIKDNLIENDELEAVAETVKNAVNTKTNIFENVLINIPQKKLPVKETTNFDDFIEAEDYKNIEETTLKLHEVYPELLSKEHNFRAIANYRIKLSKEFYTVVVTVLKGDHEMESTLINYDEYGNIIDHQLVSYDEIAEGLSKVTSNIKKDTLTVTDVLLTDDKKETVKVFEIFDNGKLKELKKLKKAVFDNNAIIESVITQLNLKDSKLPSELVVIKKTPNNSNESIVVIPEIVVEDEHYYKFNSHIAIVDNISHKIKHKYFESHKTNGWVSDAIELKEITIDTAPYLLTDSIRAFGIRVYYIGISRANPYENKHLSLFIKSADTLTKVLHNLEVMSYGGEWDTECVGEFERDEKTLIIGDQTTNGYKDIIIKNKTTSTINKEDESGDCNSDDFISNHTSTLKFDGKMYTEE